MAMLIPPPVYALAAGGCMWLIDAMAVDWRIAAPARVYLAAALVGVGLAIDLAAAVRFRRARTTINPLAPDRTSSLVAGGLYRYSRNPMYLGLLLALSGWGVWLGNPANVLVLVLFVVAVTRFQILPEERALEAKFGDAYRAYRARVRRWI